jgi:PhoH-like ATPase
MKTFILDTNVILHDYQCLENFEEHDIVIPITVLEEIDAFKRGHDQIHFNAREFIRILDALSGDRLVTDGAPLGDGRGKVRILTTRQDEPEVQEVLSTGKTDNRILSIALHLTRHETGETILVSKDVNLRLKAKSLGIMAQDYSSDKIDDIRSLYKGKRILDHVACQHIQRLYGDQSDDMTPDELGLDGLQANEYLILRNHSRSVLAQLHSESGRIRRVEKQTACGITPRNADQVFAIHALLDPEILLVTLAGKAGTGKTLLALAAALESRHLFQQIYLARPIVPLSNRDLGFLPGDIKEKLEPYMQPLFDNLAVIRHRFRDNGTALQRFDDMQNSEKLVISPLAYIRGRHLERIFFIVDEAQNLTPHEVKTIITRAGEGTKIVFTGDPFQIDTPYLDSRSNGLTYLIDHMKGQSLYAHITLEKGERSKLAELASDLL